MGCSSELTIKLLSAELELKKKKIPLLPQQVKSVWEAEEEATG